MPPTNLGLHASETLDPRSKFSSKAFLCNFLGLCSAHHNSMTVTPFHAHDISKCSLGDAIHFIPLWYACLSSSWFPNHWCKSAIKCLLLLLIILWWFVIFVTFDVCFIWAWALHVFWSMPCHLYKGACLVFLWSMWWVEQACKVAFVILLISGT